MKNDLTRLTSYIGGRIHHMFDKFTNDLTQHRVLLNWLYALAYLALIFFCATTNPSSQNTAIFTTGGIVSTIFATYVLGSSYEKVQQMRSRASEREAAAAAAGAGEDADDDKANEAASGD